MQKMLQVQKRAVSLRPAILPRNLTKSCVTWEGEKALKYKVKIELNIWIKTSSKMPEKPAGKVASSCSKKGKSQSAHL